MSKTAQNLKDYFTTNVAPKVAAGTLLFTTMFTSIGDGKLGQAFGPSAAHAQSDGTQVAMAIENPNAVPVSHPPAQNAPASILQEGRFRSSDIRDWSLEEAKHAPFAASNGRMSIIVYGEGENAQRAAVYAGKMFAKHMNIDVAYLHAADNDSDPNNSRIGIYANGREKYIINVGVDRTPKEVAGLVIDDMKQAYAEEFAPQVAKVQNSPSPAGVD